MFTEANISLLNALQVFGEEWSSFTQQYSIGKNRYRTEHSELFIVFPVKLLQHAGDI